MKPKIIIGYINKLPIEGIDLKYYDNYEEVTLFLLKSGYRLIYNNLLADYYVPSTIIYENKDNTAFAYKFDSNGFLIDEPKRIVGLQCHFRQRIANENRKAA